MREIGIRHGSEGDAGLPSRFRLLGLRVTTGLRLGQDGTRLFARILQAQRPDAADGDPW